MSVSMALFSPPRLSSSLLNPNFAPRSPLCLLRKPHSLRASTDNGSSPLAASIAVEAPKSETTAETAPTAEISAVDGNGAVEAKEAKIDASKFGDTRWVNGTWDLKQFLKDGSTDWDAVIDAEARRRKWLENNPETTSNDEPVLFDTSIVPWWAWIKRYHLPEAELLNGRAAMVGFFMAYFVDSLTGVGLVDQMGNFFCKTLLFVAVAGVLLIRKNSDVENLKQLVEETTFYDRQWQAAWKEDKTE